MSNAFFESSKEIANAFLQSIVFIDDRAYVSGEIPDNHDFDALQITQAFAKSKKICAVYKPETAADIDDLSMLAKKADITVIDWQIHVQEEGTQDSSEEDAAEDDPRGPHTKRIIREILSDPLSGKGSLKLILIYTGEIGLYDIVDEIYADLEAQGINDLQKDEFSISTTNIKILVIAKPSTGTEGGEPKFKHNPILEAKVVAYSELPDFILTEFTQLTSGLLSNFVLQSLTTLRNNTFRLVKLYNKKLDPSFLAHRLLLPSQDDSKEHLIEYLSHSIHALLGYNEVGESLSLTQIKLWIDQFAFSKSVSVSNKDILLDNDFLKMLFTNGIPQAITDLWSKNNYGELPKRTIDSFTTEVHKKGSAILMADDDSNKQDSEFSILTHHKSNLKQPANTPRLSLGTIIKQEDTEKYFVCIQAKCDSVRIPEERKFLFLPLMPTGDAKFQFVIEEEDSYIKLKSIREAYEIRTIRFVPHQVNDQIVAMEDENGHFSFTSSYNEKLIWVCDLKDAHAQRIANAYASQLSRVGLDESEWLRRWG